jgi:hypothetical protein
MDCQEKEMFYGAERSGDWISSNYAEYNEFLGIGKPQGFLGLKKFFNTQGYQQAVAASQLGGGGKNYGISIGTPTSSTPPTSTVGTTWSWNPLNPSAPVTSPLNTDASNLQSGRPLVFSPSSFLNSINQGLGIKQDTASTVLGGGGSQPAAPAQTQTTAPAPAPTQTSDSSLLEYLKAQQVLKEKQEDGNKPNNTALYIGLAGAGVLLIAGFSYMAFKGK